MNKVKSLLISIGVSGLLFAGSAVAFGQQPVEPSYEVSLQLLMGSNDGGQKGNLPSNLSGISQRLKSGYAYSNYWLAETTLGRISNSGHFNSKGGSNLSQAGVSQPQSFFETNIRGLRVAPTAKGNPGFQFQDMSIGARVPVITGVVKDDSGKERPIVNYEQIGLNIVKVGLQENTPVLIGSLKIPGSNDTIFVVMTVKAVDL